MSEDGFSYISAQCCYLDTLSATVSFRVVGVLDPIPAIVEDEAGFTCKGHPSVTGLAAIYFRTCDQSYTSSWVLGELCLCIVSVQMQRANVVSAAKCICLATVLTWKD